MSRFGPLQYNGYTLLTENQLRRRLNHLSGVLLPIGYLAGILSWSLVGQILSFAFLLAAALEAIRLETDLQEQWSVLHIFYRQLRSYESDSVAGYFYYVLGGLLAWVLFPTELAVVSFMLVALGDPISGVLKTTFEELGYDVSFVIPVNFLFSFIIGVVVFAVHTTASLQLIVSLSIGGAIGFTIADGYPFQVVGFRIDDNILIPLFTNILFVGVLYLFNDGSAYLPVA